MESSAVDQWARRREAQERLAEAQRLRRVGRAQVWLEAGLLGSLGLYEAALIIGVRWAAGDSTRFGPFLLIASASMLGAIWAHHTLATRVERRFGRRHAGSLALAVVLMISVCVWLTPDLDAPWALVVLASAAAASPLLIAAARVVRR